MSNQSQGAVLANQPVAVTAGSGITIDPNTGVISVNAATISGVMKLNNGSAYNAYQWPNSPGTNGQFLQTNGAGLVDWADVQGFAVVTVGNAPPTPPTVGELWFDCLNGTLNVYQNCVGTPSPNWFNVAQPGFPVLPGNTGAVPGFAGGTGVQADPYDCTVTTVGSGNTVQIIQTVTVTGLAAFQYVPIVDLNAVLNGGRFSFTNNYADSNGDLTFDILFTDNPPSPGGTPYTAAIKVGYGSAYIEARVNVVAVLAVTGGTISGPRYVGQQLTYTPGVPSGGSTPYGTPTYKWFANGVQITGATGVNFTLTGAQLNAQITASTTYTDASGQTATGTSAAVGPVLANPGTLTITSPGSISPSTNVSVGTTLNYTAGTFTGGIPTVTPSWKWQRNGTDILGVAANATSYPTVSADANQAITVRYTVTDSATPVAATASQSTAAVTPFNPIPSPVWSPNPPLNSNAEAISSGAWGGTVPQTITASGCVEVSLNGTSFSPSVNITTAGATLYQRWKPSCVGQKSGDTITGSVDAGTQGKNDYSIQLDHVPSNVYNNITSSNVAPSATVSQTTGVALSGVNAPAYVTIASSGNTGTNIQAATSAAGPWTTLATTGTGFELLTGQTLFIRQTVGSASSTGYVANIQVGDDPAVSGAVFSTFTYTATTSSGILPTAWSPNPDLNTDAEAISSGLWNGTFPQTITATGCVEVSLNGTSFSNSVNITAAGTTLYQRWKPSCVGQKSGDTIIGSVDAGSQGKNDYSIQLDHLPSNAYNNLTATGIALGADVVGTATSTLAGVNAPAYVTIASSGNTGTNIQASTVSATGPWTTLATTGTTFPLLTGQNLYIKQTVGSSTSTPYVANIQVGDDPAVVGATFSSFSFTATTTGSAAFPGLTFDNGGAPNAAPDTVSGVAGGGSLGTLNGVANSNSWPTGFGTSLSSPVSGANPTMKFRVNGSGSYVSSALSVVPTDVLNLAWNEAYLATVADGTNATGTITGTVGGTAYTNSFTLAVKRSADWTVPSPAVINAATNTQQTTGPRTVNNFNVPVTVSFAAPTTGTSPQPMTTGTIFAIVGGGPNIPITLGSTTVTLNPGQNLEVLGDTGGTGGATYGVKITVGTSAAQDWLVTTSSVPNAITPPTMSPTGGPLNPASNSPAGITLGGGTYAVATGSPGPHTSSDWQLFGNLGSTTRNPETSAILSVAQNAASAWATQTNGGTASLMGVGYSGSLYVAVGNQGNILTSPDGSTWTTQTSGTTNQLNSVAYGGGVYVAVGNGVYTSSNATSWSSQPSGSAFFLFGVTYGGSQFVGVGSGGSIATSPTGTTWTSQTSGTADNLRSICYSGSLYVAVGDSGTILTSSNGTSWTPQTSGTTDQLLGVAYGAGVFVAVGGDGVTTRVLTSSNGITWTSQTSPGTGTLIGVTYGGGKFVVTGFSGFIASSSNGVSWSNETSGSTTALRGATYGLQYVVVGGAPATILTQSPPSTTLTLTNTTSLADMQVGDTVVEVGGGADATGTITAITPGTPSITVAPQSANWSAGVGATAKDTSRTVTLPVTTPRVSTNTISGTGTGANVWFAQENNSTTFFLGVNYLNSLYFALGTNGTLLTSPNGTTWTTQTTGATSDLRDIVYGNSLYVVAASQRILTSSNGTSWSLQGPFSSPFYGVTYGNSIFVLCGDNGTIWTSSNGTSWTPQTSGVTSLLTDVIYANSQFVIVGFSGTILTSPDGISWTPQTSGTPQGLRRVIYANSQFVVVGDNGTILTSPNGTTWTPRTSGTTWSLFGVAYDGSQYAAVGINNTVITSPNSTTWTPQTNFGTSGSFFDLTYGTSFVGVGTNNAGTSGRILNQGPTSALTISGANTDGFAVGNIVSNGLTGASAAFGTITSISGTTVNVFAQSANWANGQNLYSGQTIVNEVNYTTPPLTTYFVAQSLLTPSTTYYSRARYSASSTGTVSPWASWGSFNTSASFAISPGTQMGGGYFAGQIRVPAAGGTIYNLIVAPVRGDNTGPNASGTLLGQYSTNGGATPATILWKNAQTAESPANTAAAEDTTYGKTWTDTAATIGPPGTYPLFEWCKNSATGPNGGGGIGGFTDWYIPATNELAVLYFSLKPGGTANDTSSGSNPNSVSPYTPSTNYGPGFPNTTGNALFAGGAQAFTANSFNLYWTSNQEPGGGGVNARSQSFDSGFQSVVSKDITICYARAVRRVSA